MDLSAQALVGAESGREELWTLAVEQTLEKIGLYHKLLHIRLVGILLLIYIKPHLLTSVTDQDTDCVTTGIGGVLVSLMMTSSLCNGCKKCFVSRVTRVVWVQGSICFIRHYVSSTAILQHQWRKWTRETM